MNSWTNDYYHDSQGKILGSISLYGDKYKALLDNMFLGWFISEEHAKAAVESAFMDGFKKTEMVSDLTNEVYAKSFQKTVTDSFYFDNKKKDNLFVGQTMADTHG